LIELEKTVNCFLANFETSSNQRLVIACLYFDTPSKHKT